MKVDKNCPISEVRLAQYEKFIDKLKEPIKGSKLPDLYCVLLQASFELNENKNFFSTEYLKKFTGELLSKILNEGWAIIGCFERGAFLSNYHHTRAALELIAGYHWVTYKPNKIEKRVKKFFEFNELFLYQLYLKYKDSLDSDITQFQKYFTSDKINIWENKISDWLKLYKPKNNDILQILNWHHPARIENILSEYPNRKLKMFYGEFSLATHFSPFSHSLGTDDSVLGFPVYDNKDLSEFNKPLSIYLDSYMGLLEQVKTATGFNSNVKFPKYK